MQIPYAVMAKSVLQRRSSKILKRYFSRRNVLGTIVLLYAFPALAQDWEILGDCPDKRDWCLAMRQLDECVASSQEIVSELLGGAKAAEDQGVVLAEVADTVNPYDLEIEGHRSASVACMGKLQTFAARKEVFGPYIGVEVE